MPENTPRAEEFIETIARDGRHRRYHLQVSALPDGQLWQISDMAKTVTGGEPVLTHAPVGLFSVDRDGKVIAMNVVLERWLGVDKLPAPALMREFIENPETLLESLRAVSSSHWPQRRVVRRTRLKRSWRVTTLYLSVFMSFQSPRTQQIVGFIWWILARVNCWKISLFKAKKCKPLVSSQRELPTTLIIC